MSSFNVLKTQLQNSYSVISVTSYWLLRSAYSHTEGTTQGCEYQEVSHLELSWRLATTHQNLSGFYQSVFLTSHCTVLSCMQTQTLSTLFTLLEWERQQGCPVGDFS